MGLNMSPSAVVAASCVRWREGEKEEARVSRWQNAWEKGANCAGNFEKGTNLHEWSVNVDISFTIV